MRSHARHEVETGYIATNVEMVRTDIQAAGYDIQTVGSNIRADIRVLEGHIIDASRDAQMSALREESLQYSGTVTTRGSLPRQRSNFKLYCSLSHRLHPVAHVTAIHMHRNKWYLAHYPNLLYTAKRLLHNAELSHLACNVQKCQQCRTVESSIKWQPPPWLGFVDMDLRLRGPRLYISIHAPRLVPMNAEVWDMIQFPNVEGLQALFDAGKTSVYDVNLNGNTLLRRSAIL